MQVRLQGIDLDYAGDGTNYGFLEFTETSLLCLNTVKSS